MSGWYFPRKQGAKAEEVVRAAAERRGGETMVDILVIDDDDALRDTLRAMASKTLCELVVPNDDRSLCH
jgi:hypothetical protein